MATKRPGNEQSHHKTRNKGFQGLCQDIRKHFQSILAERKKKAPDTLFVPRKEERNFALSVLFTTCKLAFFALIILGFTGVGAVLGLVEGYTNTTPDLDISQIENQSQTSFIYDSNGALITTYAGLENRTNATWDELPEYLINAIISIEDERFFYHNGIDLKRIAGAFLNNLTSSSTQGGSTITQQLIKMRVLSSEQTYKRKLQEAYLALELEKEYEKEDILTAYLNTVNFGSGNYGVKAAAKDYFNKDLDQLTLRECAMLAGIANSPSLYNPRSNYYTKNRPERTDDRTNLVLRNMYKNDKISLQEYEAALAEKVYVNPVSSTHSLYEMPHFVEYAMDDVITHMLRKRNMEDTEKNRDEVEAELRSSGYHIYLTVDPAIQNQVEETLYTWNRYPMTANESDMSIVYTNADGTQYTVPQPQAASAVMDYRTGQVKAIVGSRQAPTAAKTLNRSSSSRMPVGSSIKPIAIYGPAFEKGLNPGYTIANFPSPIEGWNSSNGYPAGGSSAYYGMTSLRTGIVRSLNIVAARTLLEEVGIETSVQTLLDLGVKESAINKDGSGLALGTSGITVMEMMGAYGAIANGGTYLEPISFTKVVDAKGQVILDAQTTQIQTPVFSKSTCWMLTEILTEAVNSGTGKNARIDGITVAGKTGTNNDSRGVFFAGYTGYYTSTLWIGHDNFRPLYSGSSGGNDAAPLWQAYMAKIHEGLSDREIIASSPESLGLLQAEICPISGLLATDACYLDSEGKQPELQWCQAELSRSCTMHEQVSFCTVSGMLAGQHCPAELREEKSLIKINEDSALATIDPELVAEYLPNAIQELPHEPQTDEELLFAAQDGNNYHYCTIHTAAWAAEQEEVRQVREQADSLVREANGMLRQYGTMLTANWKNLLQSQTSVLNAYMDETSYPTLADITKAYEDLKITVDSLHQFLAPVT